MGIATQMVPIPHQGIFASWVRARLEGGMVTPIDVQDSSALRALAVANALIVRPIAAPAVPVNGEVSVYWLENGGGA